MILVAPSTPRVRRLQAAAFSLIEVMAVIAIIAIMMAMLAPSISTFSSTAGRKGAVNILMNTFEQARAAALETGCDVYVFLSRRDFPDQDAVLVARQKVEWLDEDDSEGLVPLSPWIKLPKGVILRTIGRSLTGSELPPDIQPDDLPGRHQDKKRLSVLRFNSSGGIKSPANDLRLFLSEGVRDADGNEARVGSSAQSPSLEQLSFTRFTGRARLDVTTVD